MGKVITGFDNLRGRLRQWRFPKEFRIHPVQWSAELFSLVKQLAEHLAQAPPASKDEESSKEQMQMLADVGTGLWRLKQKMVQPGSGLPLPEMRRAYRHLEHTWEALTEAGVEIQDHTDSLFDSGLSLQVIAFQPTPGVKQEKVIETIKPSIYYRGNRIQMGQVVVGTPENIDK
jgi:hypothetical protein